ncbi:MULTISPECIES: type 4a pilus biogenesis lipoprotein PilP [unclassified Pseudomonas]|uniref:type 4a pilus biogenesis lipoprotein PilP n=1 Tax=unclassified Pseudomonas TaxID=196821 RepID=UPI002ACB0BB3|nr:MULTISPECIES: type 4a pilus biogenesis lipoprotein PilP [unclassified Pseudomonas]MEB0040192.1 type 4a pilus biogenesis lipoprotein PilP [Pseudomonas sp. MH10]MEB0090613.1 type 4a pilus biogenesis lipoprotein PilP [Pseudomonas sp. CCI4.2]MEB0119909.1 type 4a pilus biogenesis lipoprotein PilP [Pseudomonas sp. CCI1.2]WPX54732.1 type 4a pilus biogenesis lipoprotein PilP [Pseudomonas sp. CCI4.2]WPX62189.1 type 4a pilus biogenesis lipoprotein PilP [Pseudomonas sp. MH10]
MRATGLLCISVTLISLAGCDNANQFGDLQTYMDEVRARPTGVIEPLPKFRPYEAFSYSAAALRSPFQPPIKVDLTKRQKGSKEVKPDETRVKQFLEGFNIEQFEMVGTMANLSGTFALVRGAGGVYRMKVGDYLGRNDGRIVAISDSQVDVVELVPDGEGAWLERPRIISLKEKS